jgi:hypothetical protein
LDCGVIAIQAVTGYKRSFARKLANAVGYNPDKGMKRGTIEEALIKRGFKVNCYAPRPGTTPATFAVSHESGSYLIYIESHVMALVEGDLHNSRGSWRMPVDQITEVTK